MIKPAVWLAILLSCLSFGASANSGSTVYQMHCAQCHGANGEPTMPRAANFNRQEGLQQSQSALYERIEQGNRSCPPFIGILQNEDIIRLIGYLRTMGR